MLGNSAELEIKRLGKEIVNQAKERLRHISQLQEKLNFIKADQETEVDLCNMQFEEAADAEVDRFEKQTRVGGRLSHTGKATQP